MTKNRKKTLGRKKRKVGFVKPHPTVSQCTRSVVEEEAESGKLNKNVILKWLRDVRKQDKKLMVITGLNNIILSLQTPKLVKVVIASTTGTQNANIHLPSLCHYYNVPLVFCEQFTDQVSRITSSSAGVGETCVGITTEVPTEITAMSYATPSYLQCLDNCKP